MVMKIFARILITDLKIFTYEKFIDYLITYRPIKLDALIFFKHL